MNILADANLDAMIVHWLRDQGNDVLYAAESAQAEPDILLLNQANEQGRIVITADRDFGDLIFRQKLNSRGIVLLRLHGQSQVVRLKAFIDLWDQIRSKVEGHFVVATENRLRIRRLS